MMPRASRISACLLSLAVVLVVFSGCGWKGEGGDVAAALMETSQVKTRAFTGSLKTTSAREAKSTDMTFRGAIDTRQDDNPKMLIEMTAQGETTAVVAPGDGKLYITAGGKSYAMSLPAGRAKAATIDPGGIYLALADAVGDFKEAPAPAGSAASDLRTVTATISKAKLCGPVIEAFGDATAQASGLGGSFGGGSGAQQAKAFTKICEGMLSEDPRVWFGIDQGRLTDVSLAATIEVPLAGRMKIEVTYHEFNQDGEQQGFEAPAGATPITSPAQLVGS